MTEGDICCRIEIADISAAAVCDFISGTEKKIYNQKIFKYKTKNY